MVQELILQDPCVTPDDSYFELARLLSEQHVGGCFVNALLRSNLCDVTKVTILFSTHTHIVATCQTLSPNTAILWLLACIAFIGLLRELVVKSVLVKVAVGEVPRLLFNQKDRGPTGPRLVRHIVLFWHEVDTIYKLTPGKAARIWTQQKCGFLRLSASQVPKQQPRFATTQS